MLALDEPTAGLDPQGRRQLLDLILGLHRTGITLVIISHNMEELAAICDRLYVITDGRTAMQGSPAEIFGHAQELRGMGLDAPGRHAHGPAGRAGVDPAWPSRLYRRRTGRSVSRRVVGRARGVGAGTLDWSTVSFSFAVLSSQPFITTVHHNRIGGILMASTYIHNGVLIDGRGGASIPDAAVLVEDNRIRAAGAVTGVPRPAGDVTLLDAQGGYILPGFIDTHVHVMTEGIDVIKDMQTPFSMRFYNAMNHLRRTLEAGLTSVRDAGGADAGVKRAVETGVIAGPLQISISALTITGGHGDGWMLSGGEYEMFPAYPGMPDGKADGLDEVRKKVREMLRAGADIIKIHATGGVLSPTDHPEFTQYSPEELEVIVREAAYRRGIKVMAHAQGAEGVKKARCAPASIPSSTASTWTTRPSN